MRKSSSNQVLGQNGLYERRNGSSMKIVLFYEEKKKVHLRDEILLKDLSPPLCIVKQAAFDERLFFKQA